MIHTLTTKQLRKLIEALGDGSNWPKMTDDPQINYAVDCILHTDGQCPPLNDNDYDGIPLYDEQIYINEAKMFSEHSESRPISAEKWLGKFQEWCTAKQKEQKNG